MALETEPVIKSRIAEAIIEQLFKKLGFYVIKTGKEHIADPLTQLQDFMNKCNEKCELKHQHNFRIQRDDYINPESHLGKLPDFTIVLPDGNTYFVEVKYRKHGTPPTEKESRVFEFYPKTIMIVVNTTIPDNFPIGVDKEEVNPNLIDELRKTRFHVWGLAELWIPEEELDQKYPEEDEEDLEDDSEMLPGLAPTSLKTLLSAIFPTFNPEIVDYHERLAEKWLPLD